MAEPVGGPQDRPGKDRRAFLAWMVGALAAVNGLVLGLPFVGSLISSRTAEKKDAWSRVAPVERVPMGRPVEFRFTFPAEEAFLHETVLNSVWVIRHGPAEVTVFSPVCTHLGCHFIWSGENGRFECPCHASVFSLDGAVLYGPAPRSLDRLPAKIENGVLYVQWKRFRAGTPEKIAL